MMNQKGYTLPELMYMVVWVVGVFGWLANIWQMVASVSDAITGLFILKAIGIVVFPVGSVLGLIGIF